jgi:hypothetical protein
MTNAASARHMMFDFAQRTGLTSSERPPVRYLWTDAFAVCNFLGLFVEHGDEDALRLALRLVEQTHHALGRHRPDDPRCGWISGLSSEEEGEFHPTRGGLRIGKPLPEADDALGIVGLLCDAHRLVQLTVAGALDKPRLLKDLLGSSLRGLEFLVAQGVLRRGAERRLGFRELGLSIGLHAVERIRGLGTEPFGECFGVLLDDIARYEPLAGQVGRFWLEPAHRVAASWRDHRDINDVMLATSLAPAGYLGWTG